MTIENPAKLLENIRERMDFSGEPDMGFDEILATRSDGCTIWARTCKTEDDGRKYTIGLSTKDGLCIMQVNYIQFKDFSVFLNSISVGTPAVRDAEYEFTVWYYVINRWQEGGTTGNRWYYFERPKAEKNKIEKLHESGLFLTSNDLKKMDITQTANVFLEKLEMWVKDPGLFEKADLKPVLFLE